MRGVNWAGGWRGEERENEEGAGKGGSGLNPTMETRWHRTDTAQFIVCASCWLAGLNPAADQP